MTIPTSGGGPLDTPAATALGITHPVVLAPMGGVAGGRLAAAVSDAGGLGLIGVGYAESEWLLREFAAAAGSRVGCGFVTWLLARRPELLDIALDRDPAAVMLSFGDVAPFAARIRDRGVPLICQVSNVREAECALDDGADLVVAQGSEGGGHGRHERSTMTLVPEVCDLASRRGTGTPVLAAGGIADGRALAAALMLGAGGVVIGTRFWASDEALVSRRAQDRVVGAGGDETTTTTVYDRVRGVTWPEGYTSRVMTSPFMSMWDGHEVQLDRELDHAAETYQRGVQNDDVDVVAITVGEAIGLISSTGPAAEVVSTLVSGAVTALGPRGVSAT